MKGSDDAYDEINKLTSWSSQSMRCRLNLIWTFD